MYHVELHICLEENRSGLVKRTMNREGDGARVKRECRGTPPGSDLMDPGVKQLELH